MFPLILRADTGCGSTRASRSEPKLVVFFREHKGARSTLADTLAIVRTKDIYKSKWFAFEALNFLMDRDKPRQGLTTQDTANSEATTNNQNPEISSASEIPPPKKAKQDIKLKMLKEALGILKESVNRPPPATNENDRELQSFFNFIIEKMKKYSAHTKNTVQQEIFQIISRADRGYYDYATQYGYYSQQNNPTQPINLQSSQYPTIATTATTSVSSVAIDQPSPSTSHECSNIMSPSSCQSDLSDFNADGYYKKMARNRKRKTDYGLHSEKDMAEAILMLESGVSLRKAANEKHVNSMTLQRYVQKTKKCSEDERHMRLTPNHANRVVFSVDQEKALVEYLVNCSRMCYGLDTIECRKLAYEMAVYYNLKIPKNWEDKKMAGIDWLYGFRKRHTDLTLRKPEPCSLTRATSFNRHNVNVFFNNLEDVMRRCPSFADGSTLPPAMVFPRKQFKSLMLNGAPVGTLGLAQPTEWMNSDLFPEVMKHFVKVTASTKENPSLLIVDNHDSHLAPAVLNIAKDNGVTLLTIPPHSSHRLQPLDVSVFGPLQTYYNAAMDSWLMRHPRKTISIYNIAELLGQAFDRAMTPSNIKSGFRKTGIFPFDRHIFTDIEFMPSEVTNRPLEDLSNAPDPSRPYETQQASTDGPVQVNLLVMISQTDTRSSDSSQIQRGDVTDPRPYPLIVQAPASPVRQSIELNLRKHHP
ncbi:hypothetical protein EVAR_96368_1 [Eumeta japonica]|uniref:Uncharacterized protein n=1 Tax=Eumeta variegata TaxID=151549 RepID=A0A4C1VV55_EUMVA|nr:hypothetical protein EVAR_96368_1 [Eumeta japonica]